MRGRPKTPIARRKLEGNRSKRRMPTEPEILPVAASGLPDWYPKSSHAFYTRYAPEIRRLSGAGESDEAAMQALSLTWGLAMDAAHKAVRGRLTQKDVNKELRKHPGLQVFRDQMQLWINLASRFGLTPADRARMIGKHEERDKNSGLLNGQWREEKAQLAETLNRIGETASRIN